MSVDFDFCDWAKPDYMIRLSEIKSGGYLWWLCVPLKVEISTNYTF